MVYLDGPFCNGSDYDFLNNYNHIRLYTANHSQGKAVCVNKLLDEALGMYIFLIDSDDLSLIGRADAQVQILDRSDSLIVGSNFYFWGSNNAFFYSNYPCCNIQIKLSFWKYPFLLYSSIAIKKNDLQKHSFRLDENLNGGIDYELYSRVFQSMQVINTAKPLVVYKVNSPGGITSSTTTRREQLAVHKRIMGNLLGIDVSSRGEKLKEILFNRIVLGSGSTLSMEEKELLDSFLSDLHTGSCNPPYFSIDINGDDFRVHLIKTIEELIG